jgi:acetyl-CoA decarbonylase/synthase complex subunit gamma
MNQPFVTDAVETCAGAVPRVSAHLKAIDRLGAFKVRWGIGRMDYTVEPGLYAVGAPDDRSPVLVTANYKMSFDRLRKVLTGRSAWILVLDTKGINVWCAAGKGAFGNRELIERIEGSRLADIVSHRRLILPQLGAPGISAHEVKRASGFRVIYGPVRAEDLPGFMDAGMRAAPPMRKKGFPLAERAALIPMELVPALKPMIFVIPLVFLAGGLGSETTLWKGMIEHGLFAVLMLLAGLFAGTVVTPLLLPWLPGRPFSVKGAIAGGFTISTALLFAPNLPEGAELAGPVLLSLAFAAFLAMNFTGATTFTSLSGVRREMKRTMPIQIATAVTGAILWIGSLILG